jgi:hypothetical protein
MPHALYVTVAVHDRADTCLAFQLDSTCNSDCQFSTKIGIEI